MSGAVSNAVIIEVSHAVMDVSDIDDRAGDAAGTTFVATGMAIKFSVLLFNVNNFIPENYIKSTRKYVHSISGITPIL